MPARIGLIFGSVRLTIKHSSQVVGLNQKSVTGTKAYDLMHDSF